MIQKTLEEKAFDDVTDKLLDLISYMDKEEIFSGIALLHRNSEEKAGCPKVRTGMNYLKKQGKLDKALSLLADVYEAWDEWKQHRED